MPKLKKIAVSSVSFSKNQTLTAELASTGFEVTPNRVGKIIQGAELGTFFDGHDAAIVGTEIIDASVLEHCPSLRYVAKYGVGRDNLDEAALAQYGVAFGCIPGVNKRSVAELVLGFMLGHTRNLVSSIDGMRQGRWMKDGGRELSSMTVGIVGFGHTGSEVAKLLGSFGSQLLYCDILDKTKEAATLGAEKSSFSDLLANADIVSFHVPATTETRGMLNANNLTQLKPSALVINTSRGSVVDFEATCSAVSSGRLGGFAADVFPIEPDDLSRFRDQSRLYFTPHIGGNSQEAVLAMGRAAIRCLTDQNKA